MSLGFLSGFATGLSEGIDKLNEDFKERRKRDEDLIYRHNIGQMNFSKSGEATYNTFRTKLDTIHSNKSGKSTEQRADEYNKLMSDIRKAQENHASVAAKAGYVANDLLLSLDTNEMIERDGHWLPLDINAQIDDGKLALNTKTGHTYTLTSDYDENMDEVSIAEPTGNQYMSITDAFPEPVKEFKPFKVTMIDPRSGKVVSNVDVTSSAHFAEVKQNASINKYKVVHGKANAEDIELHTGWLPSGDSVNYNSGKELNQAIREGAVSAEPPKNYHSSPSTVLDNPELFKAYTDAFGPGGINNNMDAAELHYIASKVSYLNDTDISKVLIKLNDKWDFLGRFTPDQRGVFGKGIDWDKINDQGIFTGQELELIQEIAKHRGKNSPRVLITETERTSSGTLTMRTRSVSREEANLIAEKMKNRKEYTINWLGKETLEEEKPAEKTNKKSNTDSSNVKPTKVEESYTPRTDTSDISKKLNKDFREDMKEINRLIESASSKSRLDALKKKKKARIKKFSEAMSNLGKVKK